MGRRIVRYGRAQRDAQRALEDALDPIEDQFLDAKEAYWEALDAGDPAAIREAKAAKQAAAERYEDTRTWLRREAEIVRLQTRTIPRLEQALAGPMLVKAGKDDAVDDAAERARVEDTLAAAHAELEQLLAAAIPVRQALQELGGVVVGGPVPADLPPGSAEVVMPTVTARPRVHRARRKDGN